MKTAEFAAQIASVESSTLELLEAIGSDGNFDFHSVGNAKLDALCQMAWVLGLAESGRLTDLAGKGLAALKEHLKKQAGLN